MRTHAAAKVREALKQKDITSRQVSVTADGSSVNVGVKDLTLDIEEISRIAHEFESVRRCEITGDILEGGNTFIFVSYHNQTRFDLEATDSFKELVAEVKHKLSLLEGSSGIELIPGFVIFKSQGSGYQATIAWKPEKYWTLFYGANDIAFEVYIGQISGRSKKYAEGNQEVRA